MLLFLLTFLSAIFGFGGNATHPTFPIFPYSNDPKAIKQALSQLSNFIPSDSSTNLYGAIIEVQREMKFRLASTSSMFKVIIRSNQKKFVIYF